MNRTRRSEAKVAKSAAVESDDDFTYDAVSMEEERSLEEGEEDLETMVRAIQQRTEVLTSGAATLPVSIDDFLRNFLCQMKMTDTLDCFQTEWTELVDTGEINAERVGFVPEVYVQNQSLERQLKNARRERDEYKRAAASAACTLERLQRSRDVQRMKHNRVEQEHARLTEEMKKLKVRCDSNEPPVQRLNEKYQTVLRQTMRVTQVQVEDHHSLLSFTSSSCLDEDGGSSSSSASEKTTPGQTPGIPQTRFFPGFHAKNLK